MELKRDRLIAYSSIFSAALVISNVLSTKLMEIGPLIVPGGVICYAVTYLMTDVIGEVYGKAAAALNQVRAKGYGIVMPDQSEILLDEPQLIRHGNKFGVKIHAQAPSINLIKAHIETEIAPIVGSEQQARDLIAYIKENAQTENGVWETNIFGKSVEQIVEDGMEAKIAQMTDDCQQKLQDTLQKIINDSNGGLICIII